MIAFVRPVIARATSAGSRFSVAGSMSTKTGVAPRRAIDSAVAKNVNAGQIDLVALADPERVEPEHERVGAVGDADRVLDAEVLGSLALEALDLGAEDEAAAVEGAGERLFQLRDEGRVLRLDVNERNRLHDGPS